MNVILLTFFIVYNTQHFDDSKGFNKLNKGWVLYVDYSSLLLFLSGETYLRGQNTIKIGKLLFDYKASFLFLSCEYNFYVYTKDYSILFSKY